MHQQTEIIYTCPRCGHKQQAEQTCTTKHKSRGRTPLARQAVMATLSAIPYGEEFIFQDIVEACKEASPRTIHNVMSTLRKKGMLAYDRLKWKKIREKEVVADA